MKLLGAIGEAEAAQEETVERLEEEGVDAAGERFGVPVEHALISR